MKTEVKIKEIFNGAREQIQAIFKGETIKVTDDFKTEKENQKTMNECYI